ncbi:MAG: enoyl-CoA hydratase/isomerase family protein [Dongiaceae bacterium]
MSDHLLLEIKNRIAHLQINRPKALNALHPDFMEEFKAIFQRLSEDRSVSVVVLSGVGQHFGAGYDLKYDWSGRYGETVLGQRKMLQDCMSFELAPWECSKPVIAMVRGFCLAGSCELAMLCCVTIASDTSRFGEPEIRFSTSPPVVVMPWIVGLKKARELLYTGDLIDAEEALKIGMVNRVVPDAELEAETFKLARRMAAISMEGLQTTKASINKGAEIAGIRQAFDYGIEQGAMLDATETETLKTFMEIRGRDGLTAAIRWRESQFED